MEDETLGPSSPATLGDVRDLAAALAIEIVSTLDLQGAPQHLEDIGSAFLTMADAPALNPRARRLFRLFAERFVSTEDTG